jgi:hypothetical protein
MAGTVQNDWPDDDKLIELIAEHGSRAAVARALGVSHGGLGSHLQKRGLAERAKAALPGKKLLTPGAAADPDAGPSREELQEAELKDLRKRVNKQRSVDVQAERLLQEVQAAIRPAEPMYKAPRSAAAGAKRHVQALLLSDLHAGEVVVSEAVNGLNDFNWDVLVARMASIERSLLSFQKARPYPIEELHIWLLGDNLSGNIHEELAGVAEQAWRVGMLIAQFIERLVPHYPKLIVHGVAGNHPRVGKPHSSKQVFDSFDWLAYKIVDTYLSKYKSISCNFPKAAFIVAEIAGLNYLLWHGDGVRSSMPGVPWGGVMRRWNELRKQYAQQNVALDGLAVGHFHQSNLVNGGQIAMNGSLIGVNEFGLKNFGSGEKPTQLLLTFQPDKKRLTDVSYITP